VKHPDKDGDYVWAKPPGADKWHPAWRAGNDLWFVSAENPEPAAECVIGPPLVFPGAITPVRISAEAVAALLRGMGRAPAPSD